LNCRGTHLRLPCQGKAVRGKGLINSSFGERNAIFPPRLLRTLSASSFLCNDKKEARSVFLIKKRTPCGAPRIRASAVLGGNSSPSHFSRRGDGVRSLGEGDRMR